MKAVIFAGGVGTRLWPLSRKKSPKQFEKVIEDKSTLQLTIDVLLPEYSYKDIYIATGKEYVNIVKKQLPEIPAENVIGEPARRDVGPAVAYMMGFLAKKFPTEPVVVLWSDHLIREKQKFKNILKSSENFLKNDPDKIIYFGHKPRFASENLGWIETKEVTDTIAGVEFKQFAGFRYRPDNKLAQKFFSDDHFCWNLGSFASSPQFIYQMFEKFAPEVHKSIEEILSHTGKSDFEDIFAKIYSSIPKIHIDHAISEPMDPQYARVIVEDIGWSDIGAWEALKEALSERDDENVTKGNVMVEDSRDSLVFNYTNQLTVGIDLSEMLVINTEDVVLVCPKSSVPKIKKLVESLAGTPHEHLT
jgi:mannose-1-phosphate guanylyltransferase